MKRAWTNYPFRVLGDPPFKKTKPRVCSVVSWDEDRFVEAMVDSLGRNAVIPLKYLYTSKKLDTPFDPEGLPKPEVMYDYPKPSVTVDGVVFGLAGLQTNEITLQILLIKRGFPPYKGKWALPGGFVDDMDESLDDAVRRELEEETHAKGLFLEQLYTFGTPRRDPRGRVLSVAYLALVDPTTLEIQPGSDAQEAGWFDVTDLPKLGFDHDEIIATGLTRLEGKVRYQPLGFELLPKEFTLGQLQQMYEAILRRKLDKRNFRKKVLSMGILVELGRFNIATENPHRPARLYSFNRKQYDRLVKGGFNFEI